MLHKFTKENVLKGIVGVSLLVGASTAVMAAGAAGGGAEFEDAFNTFKGWVEGYGGMAISVAAIGIGGLASLAKQTPFPILTGIGSSILLVYSPSVVEGIFTALI